MPQQIEVPGMGVVEFPDGMNDDQIAAAIKQNMPQQGAMDKLTGTGGPRYQTWPERLVRGVAGALWEGATLPGDYLKEATQPPPDQISDSDVSVLSIPRVLELATMASPANPATRAGDKAIPGMRRAVSPVKPKVPTTEELSKSGAADIQAAGKSGLDLRPSAVADFSRKIQQELFDSGIHPVDAEKTFLKLKELENAPSGSIFTSSNLQSLRESLQATAQNFNANAAKDQLAASRAIKRLDNLLSEVAPADVLAGDPAATAKLLERGRGNYAAAMRSNDLTGVLDRANTGILERAQVRAQAANSGRNLDNTIRSKIASLLEKPKEVSGFSDPEIAALNKVVEGSTGRNIARNAGNVLGGGGGMGQMLTASIGAGGGAVVGGPIGAAIGAGVPAVGGVTAKYIANLLAKKSLRGVDELVRKRSPLFLERQANPQMAVVSPEGRAAVIRALLLSQQQ